MKEKPAKYRVQVIDERYRDTKHSSVWHMEQSAKHHFFRLKGWYPDFRVQMICQQNNRVMMDTHK